ncbi:MAG: hypothetical protein WBO70_05665 [Erysipelotrichaceae bacterium]
MKGRKVVGVVYLFLAIINILAYFNFRLSLPGVINDFLFDIYLSLSLIEGSNISYLIAAGIMLVAFLVAFQKRKSKFNKLIGSVVIVFSSLILVYHLFVGFTIMKDLGLLLAVGLSIYYYLEV